MTETTVKTDLLHALPVLSELGINLVGNNVKHGSILAVLLSVEEPVGDIELTGGRDDSLDGLDLLVRKLTGSIMGKKRQWGKEQKG